MKIKLSRLPILRFNVTISLFLSSFFILNSQTAQKFAVIGDYGWNPNNPASIHYQDDRDGVWLGTPYNKLAIEVVADMVKSWDPDFIVSVGDDSYWCRLQNDFSDNLQSFYGSYISQSKFYPVLGNHDYKTNIPDIGDCTRGGKNGVTLWREYFDKERYYDFVEGDIHFFAMNFNPEEPDGRGENSIQGKWLKAKLAASTSKFNVVYGHQPVYASCPAGDTHCSNPILQWPFQEWGADFVLSGDNHYYERNVVNDFTYIVNGVGGAKLDLRGSSLPISKKHFPTGSSDRRWGAMLVEVKSDNGHYLNIKMYDHNRSVQDDFNIYPNKAQWRVCD